MLHAVSPYDGRYADLGVELSAWFSEGGLIKARVYVEVKYLMLLSARGIIRSFTTKEKQFLHTLESINDKAKERIKEIELTTNHDVSAVVNFLRETLACTTLCDVIEYLHFGLTSEDVNNVSWRLSLVRARDDLILPALDTLLRVLTEIADTHKTLPMLARTHGQPAIPTTFGKEMVNYAFRLLEQKNKLSAFTFQAKFNGAVGNFNAHALTYPDINWLDFSDAFVKQLTFTPLHFTTQVNPNDDIVEYLQIMERTNNIFHGFASDMWRYISDNLIVQKSTGIGSSTMPQKTNPIDFEHSEGVTEIANGLIDVLTTRLGESRLQRDLSDTPLFRFLGEIHALTLDAIKRITYALTRIKPDGDTMHAMLWDNWAILAEPLQLMLRKAGTVDAYSIVKKHIQGKTFTKESWKHAVESITRDCGFTDNDILRQLQALTPDRYLGEAVKLVEIAVKQLRKNYH